MTTTSTLPAAAARALIDLLPGGSALTIVADPAPAAWMSKTGAAVTASFVGSPSADLAVVYADAAAVSLAAGSDSTLISTVDILRPALEAASSVLGAGVLGEALTDDASALFLDPDTQVFELKSGRTSAGWFAIRVRESAVLPASAVFTETPVSNLGRINSVEMSLTVEIGRTRMSVRDVLSLEPGAIIELDRSAGAPADILLNGRLIAHGEIVVVDQDYAVRITKILDVAVGVA